VPSGWFARKSSNISTRQPAAWFGEGKVTFRNTYGAIVGGGGVFIDSCKDCKVNNVNVNTNTNGNSAAAKKAPVATAAVKRAGVSQ